MVPETTTKFAEWSYNMLKQRRARRRRSGRYRRCIGVYRVVGKWGGRTPPNFSPQPKAWARACTSYGRVFGLKLCFSGSCFTAPIQNKAVSGYPISGSCQKAKTINQPLGSLTAAAIIAAVTVPIGAGTDPYFSHVYQNLTWEPLFRPNYIRPYALTLALRDRSGWFCGCSGPGCDFLRAFSMI